MLGLGGVGDLWTLLGGVGDRVGLGGVRDLCRLRGGVGARATRCGSKSSE